jgi:SAM-dependent methyltransferase
MSFERFKERQREAWGAAPWEPMAARFAPIHDHLVARLAPRPGDRWLDVGTGTGAVALRAARAAAEATGVDLAPGMIDRARRLAAEQRLAVRFEVGDAEGLPYEDASFDVVSSALGVFLAPDHAAAAGELARVCRPCGRLGIVAWRRDEELERLHAPFWGPPEPGAGDRRAWAREDYLTDLLGGDFELELEEGEIADDRPFRRRDVALVPGLRGAGQALGGLPRPGAGGGLPPGLRPPLRALPGGGRRQPPAPLPAHARPAQAHAGLRRARDGAHGLEPLGDLSGGFASELPVQ